MALKEWCQVNRKLLPFKLHFFFVFGGFSGVVPYIPLIAKQLGINATALGIGFSTVPVFIFFLNPIFGILVDYFQNIKVFIILLLIFSSISYSSVLFLPTIDCEMEQRAFIRISHLSNTSDSLMNLSMPFKRTCVEELAQDRIDCKLVFTEQLWCHDKELDATNFSTHMDVFYDATLSGIANKSLDTKHWITFCTESNFTFDLKCLINATVVLQCIPTITTCLFHNESSSVFYTYQFWVFMTLAVIGSVTSMSIGTLSSVACYEALETDIEVYGRQRLFGTISWGLICYLAGTLNDISDTAEISFTPGFFLMASFFVVDFIILCIIHMPKAHYSSSMCSDLRKILCSVEILMFAFGVTMIGVFNYIIAMYEFWYLQDLGASQTLLGLAVAMQCLVGEVPFLFFVGWIVNKLGHFMCLVSVFAGFALRMMLYSMLQNPWLVLPIDILHGVTFGIYHGASTSFAKIKAPKGMEATLLSVFSGLYDGLGYGIGSALGGFGLDNLGERRMFSSASMFSVGCLLIFLVASYFFRSVQERKEKQVSVLALENTICAK